MRNRFCNGAVFTLAICYLQLSCGKSDAGLQTAIIQEIDSSVVESNACVVLMSEADCGSCTAVLISKFVKVSPNSKGLFFGGTDSETLETIKNATAGKIEWLTAKSNSAFLAAANETNSKYGPYLIQFRGGAGYTVKVLK